MNTKSQGYILSFTIAIGLIFLAASNVSTETLVLSSLSKTESIDDFDRFDFFPDYHEEARNICEVKKIQKILEAEEVITGELNSEYVEWIGKNIIIPYETLNCQHKEG